MPQETIEFIIRPDGAVEERTLGIAGADCESVTKPIEEALGETLSRETTAERYLPEKQSAVATVPQHR